MDERPTFTTDEEIREMINDRKDNRTTEKKFEPRERVPQSSVDRFGNRMMMWLDDL